MIPRTKAVDETIAFLREGYRFVSNRCEGLGTDAFRTRLMLHDVVCMRGAEAAGIFYGGGNFTRTGAMPQTTLRLLQDKGSVQTLDGDAHRHRKAMFMALMTPDRMDELALLFDRHFRQAVRQEWSRRPRIVLFDEIRRVLTRVACEWAGVPLGERDEDEVTREFAAMIDHAGSVGPATLGALRLRRRTEAWIRQVIDRVRLGDLDVRKGCAVDVFAGETDSGGHRLDRKVAAVEVINIVRPMVAVARFVVFAALALEEPASRRATLAAADEAELERFVQEVRRFYPFFPVIGGRVLKAFEWHGERFGPGRWVILDLYGTNHDPSLWSEPQRFCPERFEEWDESPFDFIPQGGGAFATDHRCPGEWITIALMKQAVRLLAAAVTYDVPEQDLAISLARMPAAPRSGFVMENVREAA